MKLYKGYIALGAIAFGLFSGLAAHADDVNKETKITFSEPVQIPGIVLAAGTYTFKLVDPDADSSFVEVSNANDTKVYAMMETGSAERAKPTGRTEVTLASTGTSNPPVLTQWFYPGQTTGFQFLYPSGEESKLNQAKDRTLIARPMSAATNASE